jgi:hypothetical protein
MGDVKSVSTDISIISKDDHAVISITDLRYQQTSKELIIVNLHSKDLDMG